MSRGAARCAILVRALIVGFVLIYFSSTTFAAVDGETGTIRGVVVLDTRGGAPVNQVLVRLQGSGRAVTTDDAGRFEIDQVAAGSHELYVSAVDFILVKHADGAEFALERRSTSHLSGWASYAYGKARYRDQATGETFWADFDQRHTFNAYGLYRLNERFSASGRYREGSNYPTPGFWEERDGAFFVGTTRNELRIPTYARLDLRLNRTFTRRNTRLTLFAEVLNVLDRNNVRPGTPGINPATLEATHLFDQLFPRVPSAGILVEF